MLQNILQFGFAGVALLAGLGIWLSRGKRGVFTWAAASAGAAAVAAHYNIFWALSVFALMAVWALFCATNILDLWWRVQTGFVLFLALGSALCIYPTYHDEIHGKPVFAELDNKELTEEQRGKLKSELETKARTGDLGLSRYLLSNVPFRLVRGLDLKGGLRLVYTVEVDKAIEDKRDRYYDELRAALATSFGFHKGDTAPTVEELAKLPTKVQIEKSREQAGLITMTFVDPADSEKINSDFMKKFAGELAVHRAPDKKKLTFRIDSHVETDIRDKSVKQAMETVRRRIDEKGVKEPQLSTRDEDIIIEIAGDDQGFAEIKDLISRTARLEFKMVDDNVDYFARMAQEKSAVLPQGLQFMLEDAPLGPGTTKARYYARLRKQPHEDMQTALKRMREWAAGLQVDPDHEIAFGKVEEFNDKDVLEEVGWRTYYLFRKAEITGDMVRAAHKQLDPQRGWAVGMELSQVGAERFEDVTGRNIMKRFAIVLDGKVESAPRIEGKIGGGRCQITMGSGDRDQQLADAGKLEIVIKSGALPAPISPSSQQHIGPSLGQDSLTLALKGAASGAVLVLVFMVVYYSRAGMIANIAVLFNLVLQVAVLAIWGASMTLPGIAGLVLTIGIAVDANVLINERIREELRNGKSPRAAVDVGYDKAFSAILDGHVTTLLSGLVLAQLGTGPIKGFAWTLLVGIAVSLFTGVVCTRLMFDFAVRWRKIKTLHLG
jgi:preprotein translocase subunit SecD